jgi:uncharacterized Zn-binding protein involved in type VI secretion
MDGPIRHNGGPIIEGSETVHIEGLPATRLGHHAQCNGPQDTIVTGSATVFINGKPAARMGDSTAHGGVIIGGAGTVFIGGATTRLKSGSPAPASRPSHPANGDPSRTVSAPAAGKPPRLSPAAQGKKDRRMARLKLISDARARAATMKGPERDKMLRAARDFEQHIEAAEMAALSKDSYHYFDKSIKRPPVGYTRGSESPQLLPKDVTRALLAPKKSQFRAEVYFPDKDIFGADAQPILVYKGTTIQNLQDIVADIKQSRGWKCDYYKQSIELAQKFDKGVNGKFIVAGHSLGGGEASAAGVVTGARTFTINPAGLHANTIAPYKKNLTQGQHINDYIVDGEVLNTAQDNSTAAGLAMLGIHPAIGANIIANPLPTHVGRSVKVPGNVGNLGQPVSHNPCSKHSIDTLSLIHISEPTRPY